MISSRPGRTRDGEGLPRLDQLGRVHWIKMQRMGRRFRGPRIDLDLEHLESRSGSSLGSFCQTISACYGPTGTHGLFLSTLIDARPRPPGTRLTSAAFTRHSKHWQWVALDGRRVSESGGMTVRGSKGSGGRVEVVWGEVSKAVLGFIFRFRGSGSDSGFGGCCDRPSLSTLRGRRQPIIVETRRERKQLFPGHPARVEKTTIRPTGRLNRPLRMTRQDL